MIKRSVAQKIHHLGEYRVAPHHQSMAGGHCYEICHSRDRSFSDADSAIAWPVGQTRQKIAVMCIARDNPEFKINRPQFERY